MSEESSNKNNNELKVIIVHDETSHDVLFNLRYINDEYEFDRYFNFKRNLSEKCSRLFARISDNIAKILSKKVKKCKRNEKDITVNINLLFKKDKEKVNIDSASCLDIFIRNSDEYILQIDNINYTIDLNPPLITCLELPKKNIMAGFLIYPSKLDGSHFNIYDTHFKWFRSKEKFESYDKAKGDDFKNVIWEKVGQGLQIFTSTEDVSRLWKIVCTPYSGSRKGPDSEAIFSDLITPGPGFCPFEKRHLLTPSVLDHDHVRVVSYNLLADLYSDSDYSRTILYPSCPAYALSIEYRKQLFIKEILGYNGDILCLQEVDEKIFSRDLEPILKQYGLDGHFRTKGGDSVSEGSATFYRKDKLRLKDVHYFIFSEELESNPLFLDLLHNLKQNPVLFEAFKKRTTILQVSVFIREKNPSQLVVVGVTHLYFEPYSDHIRLLQAGMALYLLRQIMDLLILQNPENNVSLLLCGDFNSVPENAVYRLMTSQLIDENDPDWSSKPGEEVKNVSFSHDLEIASACGTPDYTNYTLGFNGCLDYIFYQTDKFCVQQVVPFPSHEEVTEHQALPSVTFPSDHLALVADLQWIDK